MHVKRPDHIHSNPTYRQPGRYGLKGDTTSRPASDVDTDVRLTRMWYNVSGTRDSYCVYALP